MNIVKKATEIMTNTENATISLIDKDGFPTASTISSIKTIGVHTAWFATGIDTPKVKRIKLNNKASVCYCDGSNNVSLIGTIEIVTDQNLKSDLWVDWLINHFPSGKTDPNYCLLKFTTNRLSLWVDGKSSNIKVSNMNAPQSRCGLLCEACSFKESHSCSGCVNIKNPFWGECPVKTCCENKNFTHCGECSSFPCNILHEFSCGEGEHCDNPKGLRIEQCREWAKHSLEDGKK